LSQFYKVSANNSYYFAKEVQVLLYREVLTFVDQFTATIAPPAARRIRILQINQCACLPINFGIVVTIHRSQEVLKVLSLYMKAFLAPANEALIHL
jgi:hypothetical protein